MQQQHGTQQQAQQAQQQGVAWQQPQQQQGMTQQPQQQQRGQPAGRRLQRMPLSAVLSPLDDLVAPGFGRVGGFLRSIEDEMNSMMRVGEVLLCDVTLLTAH